jgi:hypothetical protein
VTPPLVHATTEQGRRFVPVTVKVAAAVPAVAVAGEIAVIVGAGSDAVEIVKGKVFERAPELDTSIFTVAADTMSEIGTVAMSCVELTNCVANTDGSAGGGLLTQSTTEAFTKFVPVTVRMTLEGLHDGVVFDEVVEDDKDVMAGGMIVNGKEEEAVPPGLIAAT